jgi:hypothetical protein
MPSPPGEGERVRVRGDWPSRLIETSRLLAELPHPNPLPPGEGAVRTVAVNNVLRNDI